MGGGGQGGGGSEHRMLRARCKALLSLSARMGATQLESRDDDGAGSVSWSRQTKGKGLLDEGQRSDGRGRRQGKTRKDSFPGKEKEQLPKDKWGSTASDSREDIRQWGETSLERRDEGIGKAD